MCCRFRRRRRRRHRHGLLGDIAIAYETLTREGDDEDTDFLHHLAHLTVHGFLHLIGYDHENDAEAETMEGLESKIMVTHGPPGPMARSRARQRIWPRRLTAMPDNDSPSSINADPAHYEPRNLPVPVPPPREGGESWLTRVFRAIFGWKPNSRADLKDVLDTSRPANPASRRKKAGCSRTSSGLRERRVGDVMIPRADIVAVQQDITLGELVRTFESAAHSRLVVYNDTLDDPMAWCTSAT